ncbi:hypothetical protein RUM43_009208 [Polyplax serrata]|uniref:Calpain catalytic domain-containing protein n=1 Tax=Polyplax serrata TaxID=468196 RepID=A0AAN8S105_POLSC
MRLEKYARVFVCLYAMEKWTPMRLLKSKLEKVNTFRDQKYEKIKKQLTEQGCIFTDLTFPPSVASLGTNSSNTPSAIEWKRPKELSDAPRLFGYNSFTTKVKPGELSSNWMVSAFRILSGVRELCYKIVVNYPDQEWDSESEEKYTGIFHFRFWRFGQWVDVVIDDMLPTIDGKLVFTHSHSKDEFWVSLVEKAYAKLLGSYDHLEEGHISDALVDMTGGVSEIIDLKSREYDSSDDMRSELLHLLTSEMANHSIMCASIVSYEVLDYNLLNEGRGHGNSSRFRFAQSGRLEI